MAVVIPPYLPEKCPTSEKKVRDALSNLDDVTVLHSVCWQSERNNRQGDGEADFIVIFPKLGILILEVKGGDIKIENGSWYSVDRKKAKHKIKDPFNQAKDSKYALIKFLSKIDYNLNSIPIMHGVVFPDVLVQESLAINAPRELILDRNDLKHPLTALRKTIAHWGYEHSFPDVHLGKVINLLAPTQYVTKLLPDEFNDVDKGLVELTNEQVRTLDALKRAQKAIIYGGAGTGKTILATEKSKQLSGRKHKTLFVCYNALLKTKLDEALSGTKVIVETFHSLVLKEASKAQIKLPATLKSNWYENDAARVFKEATSITGSKFDAIIVDEAQDFSTNWLNALHNIIEENGVFYLFADSHQDLYRREWSIPPGLSPYELSKNCRNTYPIAKKVARIYTDSCLDHGLSGPTPEFVLVKETSRAIGAVERIVERLLDENVSHTDITILSDSNQFVDELRQCCVREYVFSDYGKYGICVETIRKFKGLESHAVIVVLLNDEPEESCKPLGYVGLSRAKSIAFLVTSEQTKNQLNWD